jgi:hypothetical protein
MAKKSKIKLKPGASIGELAAEQDSKFLADAFINHPAADALKDVRSHQSLLLGRAGSGKSAILLHIEANVERVTRINPRDVAFQYMGTSAVIQQITELGVDLHNLYEYLWTHVVTLHITREFLGANSEEGLRGLIYRLKERVLRDPKREIAVRYLEQHAENFFLGIEKVSSEITEKISNKLAAEIGISSEVLKAKFEAGGEIKDEHKRVFKYRAQEVVSSLQMRELKETINAIEEWMDERQPHYVIIDDLDLEWGGSEQTQYSLIRALIETLKTLKRIPNLKIIVAMREDLYESTLRTTSDKHFQAEKQEGIIKRLRWSEALLGSLVEKRIQ